jgi:hypothetical protein
MPHWFHRRHDPLREVLEGQVQIMADITGLQAYLVQLGTDVTTADAAVVAALTANTAAVAALQAQIASLVAGEVTQDQIDGMSATVSTIDLAVQAITAAATPVVPPAPVTETA